MRSIRPAAARALRASQPQESYAAFRISQRPSPCLFCVHRQSQPLSRRQQSTSTASNTRETPFDAVASAASQTPQTHYSFFPIALPNGPPPKGAFSVDLNALKKEFLELQARAHPDLHPPANKKRAEALSSRINEAYKTLQDPLRRAQYLLSLQGIEVAEDETAKVEDPELLMEVLEAREAIEDAEREEDLVDMRDENEVRIRESVEALGKAFEEEDVGGAKAEAVKLRYWMNIKESIQEWEKGVPVVLKH